MLGNDTFATNDVIDLPRKQQQYRDLRVDLKVLIVGLGQLGLPVAKYVKERGFDTYGYDISLT
ncbi:hypothetical protein DYY65_06390, partial [Nitrososphaera sp. AFS]|nr:hypothetical protein [Nitrososphaera sp. AFS]